MAAHSSLLSPIRIGALQLDARLFKAATMESMAGPDGTVTEDLLSFYEPYARAGTPLIVTGSFYVRAEGALVPGTCGIDSDAQVPGLTRLAQTVHAPGTGAHLFVQLNHGGRQVVRFKGGGDRSRGGGPQLPVYSASNVVDPVLWTRPQPLTAEEIQELVAAYTDAAVRCARAGCDGVELHAGHGFLISQFLTPRTNRRTDEYGGSLRRRARFFLEIVASIKRELGASYPVIAKMNGADLLPGRRGLSSEQLAEIAWMAQEEGLDAVTVTVGHYESGLAMLRGQMRPMVRAFVDGGLAMRLPAAVKAGVRLSVPLVAAVGYLLWRHREGFNLRYTAAFKRRLEIPVIGIGGFGSAAAMAGAIDAGECDAIASARALLADPFLLRHLRAGESPHPACNFCSACAGRLGGSPTSCYNPALQHRRRRMLANEMAASVPEANT